MKKSCSNCMYFSTASSESKNNYFSTASSASKMGTCSIADEVVISSYGTFVECKCWVSDGLSSEKKLTKTIETLLKPWIRQRDCRFKRSMELVTHISTLFENGEFEIFDAVKAASDLKALIYNGKETVHSIKEVWTYRSQSDETKEFYLAITSDGKFVMNDENFNTHWFDIETQFRDCIESILKIFKNLFNQR